MRWKLQPKYEPKNGDIRIITKFLLFPLTINNECRWLEKAKIKQRYYHNYDAFEDFYGWEDLEWAS